MDEKQRNLAVRIVQAILDLERQQDANLRALITPGLEEDQRAFGPAPEAPSTHQERAKATLLLAAEQVLRDEVQAMRLYRDATAEALWGDDWENAVFAYRSWRRLRLRNEAG